MALSSFTSSFGSFFSGTATKAVAGVALGATVASGGAVAAVTTSAPVNYIRPDSDIVQTANDGNIRVAQAIIRVEKSVPRKVVDKIASNHPVVSEASREKVAGILAEIDKMRAQILHDANSEAARLVAETAKSAEDLTRMLPSRSKAQHSVEELSQAETLSMSSDDVEAVKPVKPVVKKPNITAPPSVPTTAPTAVTTVSTSNPASNSGSWSSKTGFSSKFSSTTSTSDTEKTTPAPVVTPAQEPSVSEDKTPVAEEQAPVEQTQGTVDEALHEIVEATYEESVSFEGDKPVWIGEVEPQEGTQAWHDWHAKYGVAHAQFQRDVNDYLATQTSTSAQEQLEDALEEVVSDNKIEQIDNEIDDAQEAVDEVEQELQEAVEEADDEEVVELDDDEIFDDGSDDSSDDTSQEDEKTAKLQEELARQQAELERLQRERDELLARQKAEAEEQARIEAEARARAEAEEQARIQAEAEEQARIQAEAKEQERLKADAERQRIEEQERLNSEAQVLAEQMAQQQSGSGSTVTPTPTPSVPPTTSSSAIVMTPLSSGSALTNAQKQSVIGEYEKRLAQNINNGSDYGRYSTIEAVLLGDASNTPVGVSANGMTPEMKQLNNRFQARFVQRVNELRSALGLNPVSIMELSEGQADALITHAITTEREGRHNLRDPHLQGVWQATSGAKAGYGFGGCRSLAESFIPTGMDATIAGQTPERLADEAFYLYASEYVYIGKNDARTGHVTQIINPSTTVAYPTLLVMNTVHINGASWAASANGRFETSYFSSVVYGMR